MKMDRCTSQIRSVGPDTMNTLEINIPKKTVTWAMDTVQLSGRKRTREERDSAEALITMRYTAAERKAAGGLLQLGK